MARLDYCWKIDLGLWGGYVCFIIFMIFWNKEKERRKKKGVVKIENTKPFFKISSLCLTKLSKLN